jgi:hypothetical protein
MASPFCGISDLHVDVNEVAMQHRVRRRRAIRSMRPDRQLSRQTFAPMEATLDGLAKVRAQIHGSIYDVLGNQASEGSGDERHGYSAGAKRMRSVPGEQRSYLVLLIWFIHRAVCDVRLAAAARCFHRLKELI